MDSFSLLLDFFLSLSSFSAILFIFYIWNLLNNDIEKLYWNNYKSKHLKFKNMFFQSLLVIFILVLIIITLI